MIHQTKVIPRAFESWVNMPQFPYLLFADDVRKLQSTKDAPRKSKIQLLQSPALWNRKIAELVDACVAASGPIIVCGPKSSGKSTFSRLLSNQLLSRIESRTEARLILAVAFLDVDPGQPEFAQPGHLSLVRVTSPILGPSFCRPLTSHSSGVTVERSHCVASITPGSDPILYMDAVLDLFARYRSSLSECPLIVNTAGWVQDVGLEILVDLITNLEAAEVIYMSENGPEETVQAISGACTSARLTLLPSQETEGSSRTAAEFRAMRTMSYFHAISESAKDEDGALRWNTSPLDNMPPYYASYGGSDRAVLGVVRYGNQVAPEHLTKIINGMVLALVEIERATAFRMGQGKGNTFTKRISELLDSVTETSPEGIPYITVPERYSLDPTYSKSLGLVLVRGIDTKRRLFHILTPISLDVLKNGKPKVLVSGTPGFGLPSWAYTESIERQLYDSGVSGITKGMEIDAPDAATPSSQVDDGDASLLPRLNGTDVEEIPYVEMLRGNDQRDTGRMLRVRRDLGRSS